jgi:hypothetical protein
MEFTNMAKTVSAEKDKEVWLEIQSHKYRKHLEEIGTKMNNNKDMEAEGKQDRRLPSRVPDA